MSEYWKSQPKKFCDFCKCWIADNKPSVDFHERGKRHKENVQKRISEIQKKGIQKMHSDNSFKRDLEAMEKAALEAFKKDVANDPSLAKQYKDAVTQNKKQDGQGSTEMATAQDNVTSVVHTAEDILANWIEGTTPEGYVYYWNSLTSESRWEKPDGFISTSDIQETSQPDIPSKTNTTDTENEASNTEVTKETQETETISKETSQEDTETKGGAETETECEKGKEKEIVVSRKRTNPYGSWQSVEPVDTPDLQLPEARQYFTAPITVTEEPKLKFKFKEKTVGSLAGSSDSSTANVGFKKRKFGSRNIKKREEES